MAERLATVERRLVPADDGSLAAWRLGTGPAVLLVHGWEDNHSLWAPLIDVLADRGRSLVAFDMPAHGYSDGEWGLNPQAVDAVLAVGTALGPVDAMVAHSSGAAVAALAISEGLAVDRAVFIAPPLRADNRWLRYAERLGVSEDVALAAKANYDERLGPTRAAFDLRTALPTLDDESVVGPLRRRRTNADQRLSRGRTTVSRCRVARRRGPRSSADGTRPRGCCPDRRLPHGLVVVPKYSIRLADPSDVDAIADVFRRSSLSNEGDRAALLANPDVLVFDDATGT